MELKNQYYHQRNKENYTKKVKQVISNKNETVDKLKAKIQFAKASHVVTHFNFKYFVTFIDDYSLCTWVCLMKNRSELFSIFETFYNEIKTQFGIPIRSVCSDNVHEYLSHQLQKFMPSKGVLH